MAMLCSGVPHEIHEVNLKNKPEAMLALSPKGTVPVLHCSDGTVIEQSLEIMIWALKQNDPVHWLNSYETAQSKQLISLNDGEFKKWLDRYKYFERYPEQSRLQYRELAEQTLISRLEEQLSKTQFLCGKQPTLADVAIFPFIRQFAAVDASWFEGSRWQRTKAWLKDWTQTALFTKVMATSKLESKS